MELWKIHQFCDSASLAELRAAREALCQALDAGRLRGTNARAALEILQEAIVLKEMFKER